MEKKEEKFGGFVKPLTEVVEKGGWSGKYALDPIALKEKVNEAKKLIKKEEKAVEDMLKYCGLKISEEGNHTINQMKKILAIFEGK